jgi:hypothetical protein
VIGFVYILTNQYFAYDVFKIGCTERSPHERAAELSKSTGVPAPFEVLCYMEVENFQLAERAVHEWLKNYRISSNREFFEGGLHHAVCWMWHHPKRLAFCSIPDNTTFGETMLFRAEFSRYFKDGREPDFNLLPNPFDGESTEAPDAADEAYAEFVAQEATPPSGSGRGFDDIDTSDVDRAIEERTLKVVGGTEL